MACRIQNVEQVTDFRDMTPSLRQTRGSVICRFSRRTLNEEGNIVEQRGCCNLWGNTFDNIPGVAKGYRMFMKKLFR